MGDGQAYSEVRFSEINRGNLDFSTRRSNREGVSLTIGLTVNADVVRHAVQDR